MSTQLEVNGWDTLFVDDLVPYLAHDLKLDDWLTVSLTSVNSDVISFENLSVNSRDVFIGDVDIEGGEADFETLSSIREVGKNHKTRFRIYRTFKGFRVFYIEKQLTVNDRLTVELFQELGCDSNYVKFCQVLSSFAARISPKANRKENHVCRLVDEGNPILDPKIFLTVTLHDYFCVYDENWCNQWRLYNSK